MSPTRSLDSKIQQGLFGPKQKQEKKIAVVDVKWVNLFATQHAVGIILVIPISAVGKKMSNIMTPKLGIGLQNNLCKWSIAGRHR